MQLQRVAVQLAASAEMQRRRLQDDLIASFRSMVSGASGTAAVATPTHRHPQAVAVASSSRSHDHSSRFLSSVDTSSVSAAPDQAQFAAADSSDRYDESKELGGTSEFDSDATADGFCSMKGREMLRLPVVWLVLRRALGLWRRRHAGDFRAVVQLMVEQQELLDMHRQEQRDWQLQRHNLLQKINEYVSALEYERWSSSEVERQLQMRTVEAQQSLDAIASLEQQLSTTRSQLSAAASAAESADRAAATTAKALQGAIAEQGRLKEVAAVQGLRNTQLMQQQLQLMQQLDNAKRRDGTGFRFVKQFCVLWCS